MFKSDLTYNSLFSNYGLDSPLYIVKLIERMAEVEASTSDGETRLRSALELLYASNSATKN